MGDAAKGGDAGSLTSMGSGPSVTVRAITAWGLGRRCEPGVNRTCAGCDSAAEVTPCLPIARGLTWHLYAA